MSNPPIGSSRPADLPAEPNLEHLKRVAKHRLKAMRVAAPATKLADAQFELAREYGFASWRALKAEIDRRRLQAGRASPEVPDPALHAYAEPQRRVKLNTRRRLNVCVMGEGAPTVVLAAGWMGGTAHWARVQPQIARTNLTVSFDRAGLGFSDPGPLPRSISATVADLRTALGRIGARPPYVLVGHSLGGLEMQLFAFRHASEVAGLVLVDSQSDEFMAEVFRGEAFQAWSRRDYADVRHVARMSREGRLVPGTAEYAVRVGNFEPIWPDALNAAILKNRASPGFWRAYLSVIREQLHGDHASLAAERRSLGDMPVVVLTAAKTLEAGGDPAASALIRRTQANLAALSSRSAHRIVDCGHAMMWERPQAVITAIEEVLGQARAA